MNCTVSKHPAMDRRSCYLLPTFAEINKAVVMGTGHAGAGCSLGSYAQDFCLLESHTSSLNGFNHLLRVT